MREEGPELTGLLRRLSECPPDFWEEMTDDDTGPQVVAIVSDHLRAVSPDFPPELMPTMSGLRRSPANRRAVAAVTAWLLHDAWFLQRPDLVESMQRLFLGDVLERLSRLVTVRHLVQDPDRREELVRICLRELGLRPAGESELQATDRLHSLDSAERNRVLRETAQAERRAREVRQAMARAAAQDAASRYGE
jgi:hypothetical protein